MIAGSVKVSISFRLLPRRLRRPASACWVPLLPSWIWILVISMQTRLLFSQTWTKMVSCGCLGVVVRCLAR